MKKISTILLCLFIVAGLCACGRSARPDAVVKEFSEAMKKTDLEGMANTVKGNAYDTSVLDLTDEISVQLFEYMKSENTKITYTIEKSAVDGDKGTVDVTYRYSDVSPIVEATMGEYLSRAMTLAFGGASEDEIRHAYLRLIKEYHPDRLNARGITGYLRSEYEEKCKQITAAYNYLKSS